MPKFLYTIILLEILSLVGVGWTVMTKEPNTELIILMVLGLFFILVGTTTSLILFLTNKKRASHYYNPNLIYKKGIKASLIVGLIIVGLLTLKVYNILNLFTGTLFLVLLISVLSIKISNKD